MTVVATEDLAVRTTDGVALLEGVDLSVERGETVLVAGPSGSGKTTLLKAIGGFLDRRPNLETSGTVERPENVGYLFQNPSTQLVRRRVRHDAAFALENRGVPPEEMDDRIEAWAERLDATEFLDREVEELSRGETAVVALLGALVTDPDLVVLDEPLAPLDYRNTILVRKAIDVLRDRGSTLLIAERDLREVLSIADRVVVLEDGRVGARGATTDHLERLRSAGLTVPFATAVALERGRPAEDVPLAEPSGDRR